MFYHLQRLSVLFLRAVTIWFLQGTKYQTGLFCQMLENSLTWRIKWVSLFTRPLSHNHFTFDKKVFQRKKWVCVKPWTNYKLRLPTVFTLIVINSFCWRYFHSHQSAMNSGRQFMSSLMLYLQWWFMTLLPRSFLSRTLIFFLTWKRVLKASWPKTWLKSGLNSK